MKRTFGQALPILLFIFAIPCALILSIVVSTYSLFIGIVLMVGVFWSGIFVFGKLVGKLNRESLEKTFSTTLSEDAITIETKLGNVVNSYQWDEIVQIVINKKRAYGHTIVGNARFWVDTYTVTFIGKDTEEVGIVLDLSYVTLLISACKKNGVTIEEHSC